MLSNMEEEPLPKQSALHDLKKSGASRFLFFAIVMLIAGIAVWFTLPPLKADFFTIYSISLGLSAVGIALALAAAQEYRFYQIKIQLRNLERMIQKVSKQD